MFRRGFDFKTMIPQQGRWLSLGYRYLLALAGLAWLLWSTLEAPPQPQQLWLILVMAVFVAFQIIFPLNLLLSEANIIHFITLGGGLLYGVGVACWSATLGVLYGYAIRRFWLARRDRPAPPPLTWLDALSVLGMHNTAMVAALAAFGRQQGLVSNAVPPSRLLVNALFPLLLFAVVHTLLFLGGFLSRRQQAFNLQRDLVWLGLIETLPLPFILVAVMGYPAVGEASLVILGGVPVILAVLMFNVSSARSNLQRRLQELATLNQISRALQSTLDLDQLLNEIHLQVTHLLKVDNFFIAIYKADEEEIWYPLAVKNGQRVHWPPRPLADRLTDRVIRERAAVLLPHHAQDELQRIGLTAGEDSLSAWMGVPLVASEKVIGCLGVFTFSPDIEFTPEDVEWLNTLSGEVSLAIENALRYQQAQRRAEQALSRRIQQLNILEAVGRELASAIRSDRLLEIILEYALQATTSSWGSICVYDPSENLMIVKAARGYTNPLSSFSADIALCGRAARSGQVLYVPDLRKEPVLLDMSGGAARAQLCVPMIHEGRVLGVLSLESERPEAYSAADQAFAAQLATQATIAMVNAELYARAHERLSELAMVLNSLGEGFLVVDHTGQITLVNQAVQSLTHLPLGEFTGKALLEISPQALACLGYSREEAEALVQSLAQGRAPLSSRNTIRLPELPEHILERTSLPIWDPMRRSVGCMIVLRNITEEIQVAQARELITETLVHDLRSPITSILGALDVMLDLFQRSHPAADEDLILQAVNVARRGAQRVLNMVESLLEIARLESGKMEIIPTVFNLRPLVNNVLSEFLPQSTEYGLILRNEVAEDAPAVYADAAKTLRVLTNLVDNAVKFTPAGGRIIVSSTRFGNNMLAVQVSDTGPGVPQDYREKIFERFSQVPGVIGRRRGSGLGLTFCRLAVEAQGGKIWVEPRPGGGSIFTFTLPLAHSQ